MQSWRLLLTRTAPDGYLQSEHLNSLGFETKALPLIEIVTLPETTEQRSQLLDFDKYTGLIVVSKPAAELILERLDTYWPQLPIGQTWFTVGKATAEILKTAGLSTYYPHAGDNSEALWQLPKFKQHLTHPECRLLIVKGLGGREWLTTQLNKISIPTDSIALYKRRCPAITEKTIWQTIINTNINAIVISSGQSLENLHSIVKENWQQLTQLTFFVPSERIANQAKLLGIKQIINCHGASLQALIPLLNTTNYP